MAKPITKKQKTTKARGFFMRQIASAEPDLDITNGLEARL